MEDFKNSNDIINFLKSIKSSIVDDLKKSGITDISTDEKISLLCMTQIKIIDKINENHETLMSGLQLTLECLKAIAMRLNIRIELIEGDEEKVNETHN